jgi:hypothetical protein
MAASVPRLGSYTKLDTYFYLSLAEVGYPVFNTAAGKGSVSDSVVAKAQHSFWLYKYIS